MLPLIFINNIKINNMTAKEKAEQLYKDAYMRWCYELSNDKNILTAKNIATYVCNEVLNYSKDHGFIGLTEYLQEVKQEIQKL